MTGKSDIDYKNTHFKIPELTRIHSKPTTANLITLQQEIKSNAMTVHTTLGGGHYKHLGLVYNPTVYAAIPNTQPYNKPTAPVALNIQENATQYQIAQL